MASPALIPDAAGRLGRMGPRRLPLAGLIVALALAPGDLGALTRGLMQDAFVQAPAFVAATLLLFYGLERLFRFDLGLAMGQARLLQVPFAALLGATPGCCGAVMVVAACASGKVSLGAVVAALTATMGHAAFLLIAAAIGFIPGCGPQVLVATLFVNGAIPFSALVANSILNDGDALFPAIALAPRAAIMATVCSTVPAPTVAYALHFLAPSFLNEPLRK